MTVKNGWMSINKSSDSEKQKKKKRAVTVCWSCSADSKFSGLPKFVLKKIQKDIVFFGLVKGNDAGMELPLLSLKSQQSIINNFWNLIRMLVFFFFFDTKIQDFVGLLKQNRQKSVFLKVKWMLNGKKKVKWFVYSDWRKRWAVQKRFLS